MYLHTCAYWMNSVSSVYAYTRVQEYLIDGVCCWFIYLFLFGITRKLDECVYMSLRGDVFNAINPYRLTRKVWQSIQYRSRVPFSSHTQNAFPSSSGKLCISTHWANSTHSKKKWEVNFVWRNGPGCSAVCCSVCSMWWFSCLFRRCSNYFILQCGKHVQLLNYYYCVVISSSHRFKIFFN